MKKIFFTIAIVLAISLIGTAQVAINEDATDPDNSAMLDIKSTHMGLLIPRMNFSQMYNIQRPATGLLIFNTSINLFYYYDGINWRNISTHLENPSVKSINVKETLNIKPSNKPIKAKKGDLYMDEVTNKLRCWDGKVWQDLW